jgi:hypothetical protein
MTTDTENSENLVVDASPEAEIEIVEKDAEDQHSLKTNRRNQQILRFLKLVQSPAGIGWIAIFGSTAFAVMIKNSTSLSDTEFWQGISIEIYGAIITVATVILISRMFEPMISQNDAENNDELVELQKEIAELKKLIIEQNQNKPL